MIFIQIFLFVSSSDFPSGCREKCYKEVSNLWCRDQYTDCLCTLLNPVALCSDSTDWHPQLQGVHSKSAFPILMTAVNLHMACYLNNFSTKGWVLLGIVVSLATNGGFVEHSTVPWWTMSACIDCECVCVCLCVCVCACMYGVC